MQYDVTAICLDPRTGAILGHPRTERIDTETNVIFAECQRPWEIEDMYEAFWNRLNKSWEWLFPRDLGKVKVLRVEEVSDYR